MKINTATYNAIMLSASRAFMREAWLDQAIRENTPAGEFIAQKFAPFADRLREATEDVPTGKETEFSLLMFSRFTDIVL